MEKMPYESVKIPVCTGIDEFRDFMAEYPDFIFCPYVADKADDDWNISTSRVYMNRVLENFLYVPVNIAKNDIKGLEDFFSAVSKDKRIAAVNITQPHKSSPVLRRLYAGNEKVEVTIDTLIRNKDGELFPYDLNASAFMNWYKEDIGPLRGKEVVLVGIGGVGEPIARMIAKESLKSLMLIDLDDKSSLAGQLGEYTDVGYANTIEGVTPNSEAELLLINAAGKEGAIDTAKIGKFLGEYANERNVFVDIRPHLDIEIVECAKKLGWQAFTGYGMNARNDYVLLEGIARYMNVEHEPFAVFEARVAGAS